MHAPRTRASHARRRSQATQIVAALAAILLCTGSVGLRATEAPATASIDQDPPSPPLNDNIAHEIRIEVSKPGDEALRLAARLTEDGGLIQHPISWTVRELNGETVFHGDAPMADLAASPGDYEVEAAYGSARLKRTVTLVRGERLTVVFTLNVGGIRVLPRLAGLGLPPARTLTSIYALTGPAQGQLVTISDTPGEIIRVSSGSYRVESRFAPGNVTAVADVVVKSGRMAAVEIDHIAGLAHLELRGAKGSVSWLVRDAKGSELPVIPGASANVVLAPGAYRVSALAEGHETSVALAIASGQKSEVILHEPP